MKNKLIYFLLLYSTCFAQSIQISKIKFSPREYVCYYISSPLKIDGELNEPEWKKAAWTKDFVDIEGSSKPIPRFKTRVKMLWDNTYFYVGAELQEPEVWATLTQRDAIIYHDNDFEVFIDPDGDTQRYSEFEMNALNTVFDLLLTKPYRDTRKAPLIEWDIHGLKTAVAVNGTLNHPGDKDKGWTVELAFPWKAFKEIARTAVPPNDEDQWRINFSRVEWHTKVKQGMYKKVINPVIGKPYPEDNWVWSPQGVVNMHYPEMWGYIQFSINKVGSKIVQFEKRKEEAAKWYLRQIYYKERNYYDTAKSFTKDLIKIGVNSENIPGYKLCPRIECTSDYFEARLQSNDNTETVFIRNDGRVWVEHTQYNTVKK
ncbi:MAG: carbohydrate-binding family 9-like protein [Ignavibacteriaceae bacterium]